jgi:Flp pilus assembly protein TadD
MLREGGGAALRRAGNRFGAFSLVLFACLGVAGCASGSGPSNTQVTTAGSKPSEPGQVSPDGGAATQASNAPTDFLALARGTHTPADEALALGDRAYAEDNLEQADAHYRKARALDPKEPAARVGVARVVFDQSGVPMAYAAAPAHPELEKALHELDAAIGLDPEYGPALLERGRVLLVLGQAQQAVAALEHALRVRPSDPEVPSALAVALIATGHSDRALEHFKRSSELDPENSDRLANLGAAYLMQSRVSEAIETYQRALKLVPDDPRVLSDLGAAQLTLNRPDLALPHLLRAVELAPERATFHSNLGYAYQLLGKDELALQTLRKALELDAKLGSAWINLGVVLARRGTFDEAEAALKHAQSLDPSDPRVQVNLDELAALRKEGAQRKDGKPQAPPAH